MWRNDFLWVIASENHLRDRKGDLEIKMGGNHRELSGRNNEFREMVWWLIVEYIIWELDNQSEGGGKKKWDSSRRFEISRFE